jgi:ketosteroid isomerase-like protein
VDLPSTLEQRVALIRRVYEEHWLDGALDKILPFLDPEIELINPEDAVVGGVRHGIEEVAQAWSGLTTTLSDTKHELRQLEGRGEVVIAEVQFSAALRDSDLRVDHEEVQTWTFRDGRVISIEWGLDADAARRSAGF